jgi:CubicO group peptidase (beta-lactamase class C family)
MAGYAGRPDVVTRRSACAWGVLAAAALGARPALAAAAPDVDRLARRAMAAFEVPGLAVAVVEDGRTVAARGYGLRKMGAREPADEATAFAIGSCSKAFTSAAIAILVDEGKLSWDDHVVDRLPGFRLYDSYAAAELTVRDLLSHRSGLGRTRGDLMLWPWTDLAGPQVVERLRYLKPATSFRAAHGYSNVMYVTAGELIRAVSGRSWAEFVDQRILTPLGMADSASLYTRLKSANRAYGHGRLDGPARGLGRTAPIGEPVLSEAIGPAGGVCASARDMAKWLTVQLGMGQIPGGERLWSEASARTMWRPISVIGGSALPQSNPTNTHFILYALGWNLQDYRGVPILFHAGGQPGAVAHVAIVPEKKLAVAVMANAEEDACAQAVVYGLLDHYLGALPLDWVATYKADGDAMAAETTAELAKVPRTPPSPTPIRPLEAYAGTYRDPWYGDVAITRAFDGLRIAFSHTPVLRGRLEPWSPDVFRTRFEDRGAEDAWVTFAFTPDGKVDQVRMKAVSPLADSSYDFGDLLLKPGG